MTLIKFIPFIDGLRGTDCDPFMSQRKLGDV